MLQFHEEGREVGEVVRRLHYHGCVHGDVSSKVHLRKEGLEMLQPVEL